MLGSGGAQFEAEKFGWIGSANDEVSICVAWHTAGINTIEEAMQKELIVGGTGGSADTDQFPKIMNGVLGTKMKVVAGYPGGNEINLAVERGEVQGRCGWSVGPWRWPQRSPWWLAVVAPPPTRQPA